MNKTRKSANLILVRKPIGELLPHPKNPRQHDDKQIGKLRHSIKTHGFAKGSVVIQKSTGYILTGHGIVEALKKEGYDSVDVVEVDLPDDKALAFLIADNHIAEQSTWDDIALQNVINELSDNNVPALDFGFDDIDLQALADKILAGAGGSGEVVEDDFDTEQAIETITQKGDLWLLGKHRVLCGDSTLKSDVDRLMGGVKADMVFTDPPYGVSYADKNAFLNAISRGNRIQTPIESDHQSVEEMHKLWVEAFTQAYNVCNAGACYYICSPQGGELMMMMMSIIEANFELKHCLIWAKNNHVLGRLDYNYKHEPILYGWKEGGHKFYGSASETSLWEINRPLKSDLHPTMKPVELVARAVKNSSLENQIILDLFGGSGTTLIASEQLNRIAFLLEIDAHYVDVIAKRFIDFKNSADGVYVERDGQQIAYSDLTL